MCPRTLEILRRTVYISLHLDWDEAAVTARITACRQAIAAG